MSMMTSQTPPPTPSTSSQPRPSPSPSRFAAAPVVTTTTSPIATPPTAPAPFQNFISAAQSPNIFNNNNLPSSSPSLHQPTSGVSSNRNLKFNSRKRPVPAIKPTASKPCFVQSPNISTAPAAATTAAANLTTTTASAAPTSTPDLNGNTNIINNIPSPHVSNVCIISPTSPRPRPSTPSPSATIRRPSKKKPTPNANATEQNRQTFTPDKHKHKKEHLEEETEEQKREAARHVTIWNTDEHRKIAGNAAPLRRNLKRYLERHPECAEYVGQDKHPDYTNTSGGIDPDTGLPRQPQNEHVPIWNKRESRKVTGNAAPLRKNLTNYLAKHPEYEVYTGQDKKDKQNQKPQKHIHESNNNDNAKNSSSNNNNSNSNNSNDSNNNNIINNNNHNHQNGSVGKSGGANRTSPWPPSTHTNHSTNGDGGGSSIVVGGVVVEQKSPDPSREGGPTVPLQSFRFITPNGKAVAWSDNSSGTTTSAGTDAAGAVATDNDSVNSGGQEHGGIHMMILQPGDTTDLTYEEMVSSWSHNPEWAGPRTPTTPRSPGVIMATSPPASVIMGHTRGSKDHHVVGGKGLSGIISGSPDATGGGATATDVTMGGISFGTSFGGVGVIGNGGSGGLLDLSGPSMDMDVVSVGHDGVIPQFSPSNFLCSAGGSGGMGRSNRRNEDIDLDIDIDDGDDDVNDEFVDVDDDDGDDESMGEGGGSGTETENEGNTSMERSMERRAASSPVQVPSRQNNRRIGSDVFRKTR